MITLVKIDDIVSILGTDTDYSNTDGYAVVESLPDEPQETWDIVDRKLVISEEKKAEYFIKYKELAKDRITARKNNDEFADFTYGGITIQADQKSQDNLTSAILALVVAGATELQWVTADNQITTISKENIIAIGSALKERNTEIVIKARLLKDRLELCQTIEEIEELFNEN